MDKILILLLCVFALSCSKPQASFEFQQFEVLNNFQTINDSLVLEMDLSGGPYGKITLPSQHGKDGEKTFHFSFLAKNKSNNPASVFYKIYYQNESYKHPETKSSWIFPTASYNPESADNFYGSWISDSLIGFRESAIIDAHSQIAVVDSFFIAGNPTNDSTYFGYSPHNPNLSFSEIENLIKIIKNDREWYESVKEKAHRFNRTLDDQLWEDAVWTLQNSDSSQRHNQRWQRNPRVGSYRFMLVAGSKDAIQKLPDAIHDMSRIDAKYGVKLNPFYYFNHKIKADSTIQVMHASQVLKTFAVLRPDAGMFYDQSGFNSASEREKSACSNDDNSFEKAHFMQFVNTTVLDSSLHNIDLKAIIKDNSYSQTQFEQNAKTAKRNIPSYVLKPTRPCVNAWHDTEKNVLVIENPGNDKRPFKKENAGVEGRIGFAYGKYTARIKFPEIINNHNVWNGITCAFWLKFQSLDAWNTRNTCRKKGYVVHGQENGKYMLRPQDSYSEIDIEIVKTSRYWPETSYRRWNLPTYYNPAQDHNLIVACTNWDLACKDVSRFGVGAKKFNRGEKKYVVHRWDRWYRALTLKTERPAEKTVGDIFLYQIDWQPDRIIWRMGTHKNEMDEVGYMDRTLTKIPNNQMVPVMSQEFHYGHWWPTTPFPQGDIPYPVDPIRGYLFEVIIE